MDSHGFWGGLLGLMITSAILIAIPGPSIMFFIGQVVSGGRAFAIRSVIGNAIGMLFVAVPLAFGLGTLMMRSDLVLMFIRLGGAAVLMLIGVQYLFNACRATMSAEVKRAVPITTPLISGIIVGFTNPKGLVMFGTIVPSFISPATQDPVFNLLLYSMVPVVLGILIDCIWVLVAHAVTSQAFFADRGMRFVNLLGGGLIVAMSLALAHEGVGLITAS